MRFKKWKKKISNAFLVGSGFCILAAMPTFIIAAIIKEVFPGLGTGRRWGWDLNLTMAVAITVFLFTFVWVLFEKSDE